MNYYSAVQLHLLIIQFKIQSTNSKQHHKLRPPRNKFSSQLQRNPIHHSWMKMSGRRDANRTAWERNRRIAQRERAEILFSVQRESTVHCTALAPISSIRVNEIIKLFTLQMHLNLYCRPCILPTTVIACCCPSAPPSPRTWRIATNLTAPWPQPSTVLPAPASAVST